MDISASIVMQAQMAASEAKNTDTFSDLKKGFHSSDAEALRDAAEDFESIFVNMILERMRAAKLSDDPLHSQATETYTSMMDQEMAKQIAYRQSFGIADALVRQFSPAIGEEK